MAVPAERRAGSTLRRVLRAPFTRRAWADLGYAVLSFPVAIAGFVFTVVPCAAPVLLSVSTPGVRGLATASRNLADRFLGERIATAADDKPAWRARGYLAMKLPVSVLALVPWAGGLALLTVPVWWARGQPPDQVNGVAMMLFVLAGAGALLAAPWLTNAVLAMDRWLMRALLGPASLAERVRELEATRAHAVDDAAARLRSIERDLHDGAQAQLVGLAMKLGLAREKLGGGAETGLAPADLERAAELVDAAHRSAIDAITDLRVLARGIHPPVLDNGLADALATLTARSAVPVQLVADIGSRPSAAIETITYFCAAELLANVAKHSGARHATLEAVHVPGLLRLRVTDDGRGGASPEAGGGLCGLADRVRTVDGTMVISSPRGGPTVVTVELPSHA
jgi:signal transduction histidine kinase